MSPDTRRIEVVKYVRASGRDVWRALIDPGETRKYFMDRAALESDLAPGSPLAYVSRVAPESPAVVVRGRVLACDPERVLSYTFALPDLDDLDEPESRVTWTLAPFGRGHVKLALVHQDIPSATHERMKNAWGPMLVRLQTVLESGATGWQ